MVHHPQLSDIPSTSVSTLMTFFFSESDAEESRFKKSPNENVATDFMCDADFFLISSFKWNRSPDKKISVHVSQQAFSKHTASCFGLKDRNRVPLMNPYRLGYPIDSIPNPEPEYPDLPKCKDVYQSIYESINWLAISTCPEAATILSLLASCQGALNHGHYKAALHSTGYLVSISSFGLTYHSESPTFAKSFFHFPPHHNVEAYAGSTPHQPDKSHESNSYYNA